MKIQVSRQTGVVVMACIFVITQCIPYGFSANQQILAAAKANAIPTKKVSTASVLPAKTLQLLAKGGNMLNSTTDFISQGAALSATAPAKNAPAKPAVSIPTTTAFLAGGPGDTRPVDPASIRTGVSTAVQPAGSKKADQVAAALETKAATQTFIASADTTKVIMDAKAAVTASDSGQKKEGLVQAKGEVKTLETFVRLQVAPATIQYADRKDTVGSLSLPPGHSPSSDPAPVIILIHGGGFTNPDIDRHKLADQAEYFTDSGFAVLNIDYKLNDIDKALRDTRDAIQWVNTNSGTYNLDAHNISIVGTSAGATLGEMVATQSPEAVNCVVGFSAGVNAEPTKYNTEFDKVAPTYSGPYSSDIVSPKTAPSLIFTGGAYDEGGFGASDIAFGEQLAANGVDGGTIVLSPPPRPDGTPQPLPDPSKGPQFYHGANLMNPQTDQQTVNFIKEHQR